MDLYCLLYENQNSVGVASIATGNLVSHFNPQIEESLEYQRFLFDNLPVGDLVGDSILRQIGGDMSGKLTIISPIVIVDGLMYSKAASVDVKIRASFFRCQNRYINVITKSHIDPMADLLSEENERLLDFLYLM